MRIRDAFAGGCFLNLRKPKGLTSHDCVDKVRKIIKNRQIGHCGTLDPFAEGVLPLAVGRATRFIQYLNNDKEYEGSIRFGVTTSSDDIDGDILTKRPASWLSRETIAKTMQTFVGEIQQVPPRVSAIKINGQRAYDLARRNVVSSAYMMNFNALYLKLSGDFPEALINVKCGAGTYIRSIARECGEAIFHPKTRETIDLVNFEDEGDQIVGGTLATLLRKRSSNFDLKRSITLEALEADWKLNSCNVAAVHSIENALEHLHSVQLPSTLSAMYLKNQIVNFPITLIKDTGVVTVHAPSKTGRALRIYDSAKPAQLLGVSPIEMTSSGNVCLRKRLFL
ncbi:unnamed protein product [Albugo candida]|uniref:tRNA pseudouridine(55) synthase n=1 Tax=Albugo candida TaxID=65357 RepID=A0A024GVU5_9STRA|nr:unnamed protein product [Albugo candida]|eukprot:CCI50568.1 unnamed protein product [Albugo candida]